MFASPKTRRLATAVLILGILSLGLVCLAALNSARENARLAGCISNVQSIGLACATYAKSHSGALPHKLDDLKEVFAPTEWFICPSAKNRAHYSYEFTGATNIWGVSSNIVILREIEPNHHGVRVVLYDDGQSAVVHALP